MLKLKPVQVECVNAIWKELVVSDDMIVQLPTGTGKTVIFVKLLELLLEKYPHLKANVLVNKIKLVEQTQSQLLRLIDAEKIGLYCGSLGEYQNESSITVGSIQSISQRTQHFDVVIIDECHNAENSPTYSNYLKRLREANPKVKFVRFTATPFTTKGYIYGEDKPIKKLTFKRTLNQMILDGNLVPPTFKSVKNAWDTSQLQLKRGEFVMSQVEKMTKDEKKVRLQVEDAMARLAGRKKIVWAATCIEHAEILRKEIEIYEPASIIHSELTAKDRVRLLEEFENGPTRHLVSIMIVTEGYDYPPIDAIANMRPTRSPVLYVQLIGRALRVIYAPGFDLDTQQGRLDAIQASGKTDALILDYGESVEYFGHPSDPFVPGTGKKNNKNEKKCLICPACETINFLPRSNCEKCKYVFMAADKKITIVRTKSLTEEAAEVELNENGKPEYTLNVIHCGINNDYRTKDNKPCIKITYATMMGMIHEYIKKETHYHRVWNTELLKNKNTPIQIRAEKNGKYYNVVKRIYA